MQHKIMVVANINYTDSILKIEKIKTLISEFQDDIYNQIPQGITNYFDTSKLSFFNSLEEIEIALIEFKDNENE